MLGAPLMMAAQASTLLAGLLGFWKLDGNAADALAANNGTLVGTGGWTTGKLGSAYQSPGTVGSYISLGSSPTLKPATAVSVAAWLYFTSAPTANQRTCSDWHQDGGADRWILGYSPDGTNLYNHMWGVSSSIGAFGSTLAINTWYHVVLTWEQANGGWFRTYRDSSLVGGGGGYTGALPTLATAKPLCIGSQYNTGGCLTGCVDEFGLWNRALTAAEVSELYNAGTGKTHPF